MLVPFLAHVVKLTTGVSPCSIALGPMVIVYSLVCMLLLSAVVTLSVVTLRVIPVCRVVLSQARQRYAVYVLLLRKRVLWSSAQFVPLGFTLNVIGVGRGVLEVLEHPQYFQGGAEHPQ